MAAQPTPRAVVLKAHRNDVTAPPSTGLEVRDTEHRGLCDGEIRVANTHLQLAAVYSDLMTADPPLPMPAYAPGEPLWGGAVGTVVESRSADTAVGAVVHHMLGMRTESVVNAHEAFPLPSELPDPALSLNQGVTAYHGIVDVAEVGEGDVVFISGAAGGVGSLAVQIARLRGAGKVIASAGSAQKCAYLVDELGADVAIDYKHEDLAARLREEAPAGIDAFFDLVGGAQFEAAVPAAAEYARFALCGALAEQTGGAAGRPRLDVLEAILHEIRILPFRTLHTPEQIAAWNTAFGQWLAAGAITVTNTVLDGDLDRAISGLDELLAGRHTGNVIVRLT